ncbi:ParM/StbA family protein [Lactobacillus taiwanensis]|uniref:ParM/StbA family protein n=1 Tax=Lactobacillus taiwanensis TaxID=508451 RepID=UPI00321FDC97
MTLSKPTKEETMKVANDLGYGWVKAGITSHIDGNDVKTQIAMPSILAVKKQQNNYDPVSFDNKDQEETYMKDFLSHLDMAVNSPAVNMQGRFLLGQSAIESQLQSTREFDVNDASGKSDTDLSIILTLGLIAGQRVKNAYANGEDLYEQLNVVVTMATALPVLEGKTNNKITEYKQRFMNGTHTVTFNNFKEAITVKVKFAEVFVTLEGSAAQFAIMHADKQMEKDIEENFKKHYPDWNGVTGKELTQSQNVLNIDIGHGTVDIVVISDGRVNPNASSSLPFGYGNSITEAMNRLEGEGNIIGSQASFQKFINGNVGLLQRQKQEYYREVVYDQLDVLTDKIVSTVSQVLRNGGTQAELVFVHGGGSIPMAEQSNLREDLDAKLRAFNGGKSVPVVWINPDYAQIMNEKGLDLLVNSLG